MTLHQLSGQLRSCDENIQTLSVSPSSFQICTPDLVMFLACTSHRLKERLQKRAEQQGRPDDNPKAIERRLTNFKQNTIPLVQYFQERGLIVTVGGSLGRRGLFQIKI